MPNALAAEKSPYLRQHAHNPVDWLPWGAEALAKARREDRPIFLSVGYAACHWCHVMERESFEDEAAAALLNAHFVSIKVDREERPDVDEVYMTAVQLMTGQGGWPMSVFLTPEGLPFYGGTYFPPESRHGRLGFKSLVRQLADAWESRRDEVEQVARSIVAEVEKAARQRPVSGATGPVVPAALRAAAVADLARRYDEVHGGFGGAPKFPPHHALRLLCDAVRDGDDEALPLLTGTLDTMALGGIYDHIGGGFHRYATDAIWLVPHFEKMLYDNALLARVYADAYAITGQVAYARIARETCDWVLRDMADPAGGFHAALDADSEGEEGRYYVWTRAEAEPIAGASFCELWRIVDGGNFRDEATGRVTGACIPHREGELSGALTEDDAAARARLLDARYRRVPPLKDDKVIASWNGLMVGALARVGAALDEPRYVDAARRAATFCLEALSPDGALLHRWAGGEAAIPAFLDDHAYLADGLLDLADATGEARWRDAAARLADTLLADFWDPEDGGFFFTSAGRHEPLIARSKDLFDGALPSANGVAVRALARLGGEYGARARGLLEAFHGVLVRAPQGMTTLIDAAALAFSDDAPADAPIVRLTATLSRLTLAPGESGTAVFHLTLRDGWHIHARRPGRDGLIATIASLASDLPAALGPVAYPVPVEREIAGDRLLVYEGTVAFAVPVVIEEGATPGEHFLEVTVRYQPCGDSVCLAPAESVARIPVTIAAD